MLWQIPDAALIGGAFVVDSLVKGEGTFFPDSINAVMTGGHYDAGDGGTALYNRVVAEPAHPGKFRSADGAWWELASSTVSPKMFGARTDGTDDTNFIIYCSQYCTAIGNVDIDFGPYSYTVFFEGNVYDQFPMVFNGIDNISIDCSCATINVDPNKDWTGSNAAFIQLIDCENIVISISEFMSTPVAINGTFTGVEVISLRGDCKNIRVPMLNVTNCLAGLLASEPDVTGSSNIYIEQVTTTTCIYGINLANSGSNTTVNQLITNGCGRSFFVYGVSDIFVNVNSRNYKFSADVGIGVITNGFNIIQNIHVVYTNLFSDEINASGVCVQVNHSFDDGVATQIHNVNVELDVNLTNIGCGSAFEYSKINGGNPDPTDRGHIMSKMSVSGIVYGIPAFGASIQFGRQGSVWAGGDSVAEVNLNNLRITNTNAETIQTYRLMPSLKGGLYLNNIFASADINIWGSGDVGTVAPTSTAAIIGIGAIQAPNAFALNSVTGNLGVSNILAINSPVTMKSVFRGLTLNNNFAAGNIIYNLPPALASEGYKFSFIQLNGNAMLAEPNGTDIFRGQLATKAMFTNALGTSVTFECAIDGIWDVTASQGTIAYEP